MAFETVVDSARQLRAAVRALARRPAFTALTGALFALAIAAVTAILAFVESTVLRPLPYRDPAALYALSAPERVGRDSVSDLALSARLLADWRSHSATFAQIEGYTPATIKLTGSGDPEALPGAQVSAGFFSLLGVRPVLGRTFTRDEEVVGSGVAMISEGLWTRRFGRDSSVLCRTLTLDDEPRTIVGVVPTEFSMFLQAADVWVPIPLAAEQLKARSRTIAGVGRLKAIYTPAQARTDLDAIIAAVAREQPREYRFSESRIVPLRTALLGAQRTSVLVVLAAVLLLLLVAITDVASLVIADVMSRRGATLTRLALGARRWDVMRVRLLEMLVLAAVATVAGVFLARLALAALQVAAPDVLASFGTVHVDRGVTIAACAVAAVAALTAVLPAASYEASLSLSALAGAHARALGSRLDGRARELLLGAQVGFAVVLLIAAALLARNFRALTSRSPGFESAGVLVVPLTISSLTYRTPVERGAHVQRLLDAVRPLPGVQSASAIQTRFVFNETMQTLFDIEGRPVDQDVQRIANIRHVAPDLLSALRLRLLRGRAIGVQDGDGAPLVAMVSAAFAHAYFPGEDPVGKRVRRAGRADAPWMEIVGVVGDTRDAGFSVDLGPTLYVAYRQQNSALTRMTIVARVAGDPVALANSVRRAIWRVDPNQTIESADRLEDLMSRTASQPRFQALVVALFGGAALVLVLGGTYAVTLFGVLRGTRELGLRAALGANPRELVSLAMRQGLRPVVAGVAIGGAVALPATWALQRFVAEQLAVRDVPLMLVVAAGILAATAAACFAPARRVLRISPSAALRS